MQLTCDRNLFSSALRALKPAVVDKSPLPILSHYHLVTGTNTITISATNLEVTVFITFPANVQAVGDIAFPAKLVRDWLDTTNAGTLTLTYKPTTATLTASTGGGQAQFKCLAADFSTTPFESQATLATNTDLGTALRKVALAALESTTDVRQSLKSVAFILQRGLLGLAATDSNRLAYQQLAVPFNMHIQTYLIPLRVLEPLVVNLLDDVLPDSSIALDFSDSQLRLRFELKNGNTVTVLSQLLAAQPVDYLRLLPSNYQYTITTDVAALRRALQAAYVFSTEAHKRITLTFNADCLQLSSISSVGAYDEQLTYTSPEPIPEITLYHNASYILEWLKTLTAETLTIAFSTNNRVPTLWRENENGFYLTANMYLV